ncbi:MAG: hypothetical protein ACERLG_11015 [Sedimentibacter sp.]
MKKKILSLLLALCMVISIFPTVGYAVGDTITMEINGTYDSDTNTIGTSAITSGGTSLEDAILNSGVSIVDNPT